MKVKLGYPDRIVEIDGDRVYVFKRRLFSAPLDEVVEYARGGEALIPPAVREVPREVFEVLFNGGHLRKKFRSGTEDIHGVSV